MTSSTPSFAQATLFASSSPIQRLPRLTLMMSLLAPYLLLFLLAFTSYGIIVARNPVLSMLYLVVVFLQASLLFLLLGAEFLFVLFLIVYVGAVAILFLFVIMLLNLRVVESYNTFYNYLPIGLFVGLYFLLFILFFLSKDLLSPLLLDFSMKENYAHSWASFLFFKSNVYSIGELLYNYNNHFFLLAGLLLLLALLGVISLTLQPFSPSSSSYDSRRSVSASFSY